jgi:hypothetical protein
VVDTNWMLIVGVECVKENCENVVTPEGIRFMQDIDKMIENDETWHKICLMDSPTNRTCMDNPAPGFFTSKASPLVIFRGLFGEELEEMT